MSSLEHTTKAAQYKRCKTCEKEKPFTEFNRNHLGKYGLQSSCRVCQNSYGKQYRSMHSLMHKTITFYSMGKTKKCWDCKQEKLLTLFSRDSSTKDGFKTRCKQCISQYMKQYTLTHKHVRQAFLKKYSVNRREFILSQKKKRYERNKEAILSWQKGYYSRNRVRHNALSKQWKKMNRAKCRELQKRRRARKANAPMIDFTLEQWQMLQAFYGYRCVYCGKQCKGKLTQDHLTPLSKGGSHTAANIVPACHSCNASKNVGPVPIPVQPLLIVGK